ncbi:hypothetical protein GUJ93_ZPchr0006g43371 [Zizania palustris]|uniref:Uncharacterized protein n=1 Tax=Zizania palustris TaxID=103762 RepID=A0A8J5W3A6_ZIZPA|nr:hypothetical protein GUJ93_ZPchr0006g43371 [Zizania palustris]
MAPLASSTCSGEMAGQKGWPAGRVGSVTTTGRKRSVVLVAGTFTAPRPLFLLCYRPTGKEEPFSLRTQRRRHRPVVCIL